MALSSKSADSIGLGRTPARGINRNPVGDTTTPSARPRLRVEYWPFERLKPYGRNPRKNDKAVDRIRASIRQFGFAVPILAKSDGEVIDGHLRLKRAIAEKMREVPVVPCDGWTDAQVKAFRLMVNRSVNWADWDLDALALEFAELKSMEFDLSLTGFDSRGIDAFTLLPNAAEDEVPPVPEVPVSRLGDLWLLGPHRVLCGDSTSREAVARLLGERKPRLLVSDPPYGISLDSEWRDRAGLNGHGPAEPSYMKHRTAGHTETTISGDTRADWSEAFELVPSLQVAYVWHASAFTREVLNGLLRIGFVHHQQIIWDKTRIVLTRTHYWFEHEPCWYVRKKNAAWFGKPGENSTIWRCPSPKFIMGGSKEDKFDHPTQKPVELMRRPMLNHTKRGELVYEPFLGSGTTLAAAERTERVCVGVELDPKYVDVVVLRWQTLTGKQATLEAMGAPLPRSRRNARRILSVAKRGQPPYQATETDRTTVLVMIAAGIRQEDIAPCIGTKGIDPKTLRKHFPHELSIGVAKVNGLCSQGIVRAMQNGEAWALCFWAKTRMGWRERSTLEHQMLDDQGKPTRPSVVVIVEGAAGQALEPRDR